MRNIIILLSMILCLFGPTVIFTIVGRSSLQVLSNRPSNGSNAMMQLLIKLVAVAVVLIGVLTVLLKFFD